MMALGQVASRDSLRSNDTFDTLLQEADLETPNSCDEQSTGASEQAVVATPSKPLTLEEENRTLRLQLQGVRSELAYWKTKANDHDTNKDLQQTGLWEHTMNFFSTPDKTSGKDFAKTNMESPCAGVELTARADTGLHHRKSGTGGYFERLNISPFKFYEEDPASSSNTLSAEQEEGISLVKSHSSDRREESSIDSHEDDEPSFYHQLVDRGAWLVGLLVLQSFSSFIIQHNELLLQRHTVIVRFLTMLVGAGGNAGNQASVRVIRGLATGRVNDANVKPYIFSEIQTGFLLSLVLGFAGCLRAAVFLTPAAETFAITSSLVMIVATSVLLGTALPLLMQYVRIDPAHSSTTIQVLMDILGVAITVYMSSLVLDHAVGG